MAWNVPAQFAVGAVLPASALNAFRESLQETGPAVVTTVGDLVVADGANSLARFGLPASPDGEFLRARAGGGAWEAADLTRSLIIDETGNGFGELYTGTVPNDGLLVFLAVFGDRRSAFTVEINGVPTGVNWMVGNNATGRLIVQEVSSGDSIAVNTGITAARDWLVRGHLIRGYLTN